MTSLEWLKKRLGVLEKRLSKATPNSFNERALRRAIRRHKKAIREASENTNLQAEIKRLPDRLRWISDNANHHSSHWLKTQLYGLAREFESGWFDDGKMGFRTAREK